MNWWQRFWKRRELEDRLDRELRFHFDCQVAENLRAGMSEAEARRDARLRFGTIDQAKEQCREARGTLWIESTLQDLRYTARTLRKTPAFTLAAIATLALGIGANTAIFQLLDVVRLRSLPVPEPHRLARIQIRHGNAGWGVSHYPDNLTYALFEQIRDRQQGFSGVFAWEMRSQRIGEGAVARRAEVLLASGEFFTELRVSPAAGRLFHAADDLPGCAAPVAVLSHSFWQSEFAGQPSAIGSRLIVQDKPLEIIGVTAESFSGPEVGRRFDIALPMCSHAALHHGDQAPYRRRDYFWLEVMGRLAPGWTLARASEYLQSISQTLMEATLPTGYSRSSLDRYLQFRLEAVPGRSGVSRLREHYDTSLWLLLGITSLVLLIACANLANLMLARAGARQREFAIRTAMGAGRARLIRQSLCESLLLAAFGACLGLWIAATLSRAAVRFLITENDTLHLELALDWRVLAFTAAVSAATCILLGLAPALRSSRIEPAAAIKSGGRGLTSARDRLGYQRLLVVVQVAVSLVLVTGAVLFVGSFRHLITLDAGFRQDGILTAAFDLGRVGLARDAIRPSLRQLLDEVRATPQLQSAASTTNFLIGGGMWTLGIRAGAIHNSARFTWVSPGYFSLLDTPLLSGRDFNETDAEFSPRVAVVNQSFVQRFFPGAGPIGKTFRTVAEPNYPEAEYQIVGVIKDTRYFDLRDPPTAMAYGAAAQTPSVGPYSLMYVRSSAPLAAVESAVRRRVNAWRPGIGMEFHVFRRQIADGLVRERLLAALSGFFGVLAALLAAIGLYGVLAYSTVRRRDEIGIRMALGATRGQIVGMVMKEAALLVTLGLMIGLACALALARVAASLLFGVSPRDPVSFGAAAMLLAAAAVLGSFLPARRASRLDPVAALRAE